jgi:hypothetical protein
MEWMHQERWFLSTCYGDPDSCHLSDFGTPEPGCSSFFSRGKANLFGSKPLPPRQEKIFQLWLIFSHLPLVSFFGVSLGVFLLVLSSSSSDRIGKEVL